MARRYRTLADFNPSESDAMNIYRREIEGFPKLSHEQMVEASRLKNQGDPKAYEALVKGNIRFVLKVANIYTNRGVPFEDLVSAGNVGLLKAVEKFDETKGTAFTTYAVFWIRQHIQREIAMLGGASRVGRDPMMRQRKFEKRLDHYIVTGMRPDLAYDEAFTEVYGADASADTKRRLELMRSTFKPIRLNYVTESDRELGDILQLDDGTAPFHARQDQEDLKSIVQQSMEGLTPREQEAISTYYGLDGGGQRTHREAGALMGVKGQRVHQLVKKGEGTLRKNLEKRLHLL